MTEKRIHKYTLDLNRDGIQEIVMHEDAVFLAFQNQREVPTIWVAEDGSTPEVKRIYRLVMTGQAPGQTGRRYLGTAQFDGGDFVVHLFHCGDLTSEVVLAPEKLP